MNSRLPFGIDPPARSPRQALDESRAVDATSAHKVEVGIPMRDGLELAADVYLPEADQRPAPVILIGTPYDKTRIFPEDVKRRREAGYISVFYDVRGRGKSEGCWNPFARDGQDGHDVVEWIAGQEWCDGRVALDGHSYSGWVAWATARERPTAVSALISSSPAGRWQEEAPYLFGCLILYLVHWFALVRRRINDSSLHVSEILKILPVEAMTEVLRPAGPGWEEMLRHDTLDELWQSRRWDGDYTFDIPGLHITGWHDREDIWGAFHHYGQMMLSSPERDQQWLLVGPWSHASAHYPSDNYCGVQYPQGEIDMCGIKLAFLDHVLHGKSNGFVQEPRIRLYDTGAKQWVERASWNGQTEDQQLFLGDHGTLGDAPPPAGGASEYRYDPMQPNGWKFDVDGRWEPPVELGELEAQPGVLSWTSEPVGDAFTIRGWSSVEMWAETDCDDTEWHVKFADVDPQGRSLCIAWGCLRASYAVDPKNPAPVRPGQIQRYEIELTPSCHTFQPGHRVRLLLASSEYPWFARNLNAFGPIAKQVDVKVATNALHFGPGSPSRLKFQVEV